MRMPVVSVREVRMIMRESFVPMRMAMFGSGRHLEVVLVLMVLVVNMLVVVRSFFVQMFVFVALGQMQPDAQRH